MGKQPKREIILDGINFDSQEEKEFYMWLKEAKQAGYISGFAYHPKAFEITPRQVKPVSLSNGKVKEKFLFHPITYTPDFCFITSWKFELLETGLEGSPVYVDIKGQFEPVHSKIQVFSMLQKLMNHVHGIYVHKIIPADLFKKTWVPAGCAFMSNRKSLTMRKPYAGCRLLSEVNG